MPATEYHHHHHHHSSLAFLGRSLLSLRRNQPAATSAVSPAPAADSLALHDLGLFQSHVADLLHHLLLASSSSAFSPAATASVNDEEVVKKAAADTATPVAVLSLPWLGLLLDIFLSSLHRFKSLLLAASDVSPDRLVSELLDRAIKALDLCNAVSAGADSITSLRRQAQIAGSALAQAPLGDGQLRRARRALASLAASLDEENETGRAERNWSFGRRPMAAPPGKDRQLRSLSWSAPRSWSATKQLQAMAASLAPPRGSETGTLMMAVYTMSSVLVFVMWALVAAVPCGAVQLVHLPTPPRQLPWAESMAGLLDLITEEWRGREKAGARLGLLPELRRLERCSTVLLEMPPERAAEKEVVRAQAEELAEVCRILEEGLDPFQKRVREVFHEIVRSRAEVLDYLAEAARASAAPAL